jgi:hypothetical protein
MSYFFAFNAIRTATASSEDPFYPASNLLLHPTYKEYRAAGTTATIVFDTVDVVPVDSLLLCGNNATGELQVTSITLEANASNVWTSPAYSTSYSLTADNLLNNLVHLDFPSKSYRYWRLTINNPVGSYAGFSNLFLGAKIDLPVDLGYTFSLLDRSDVNRGRYGQRFIDKLPDLRTFTASMSVMNQEERDTFASIAHYCSTHTPIWMVLNPGESLEEAGYFYFNKAPEFENQAYQLYNTSFELTEVV